jgi:(R,R)-butanediol dehydrogenase/meso-butanediol dehydrogenase/diacetyl reductase
MAVAYHGVLRGRPTPGATAVVLGAGPIGIGCLLALRALGVDDVLVSEPAPERRAVAASLGATRALDPASTDVGAEILEHTGGAGAALTIDAAGVAESFRTGLAATGRKGRFVTLAAYMQPVSFNPSEVMMREIEIVASFSSCGEFEPVLQHMAAGRYPIERWVERVGFKTHVDAYDRLHRGSAMKILVDVGS